MQKKRISNLKDKTFDVTESEKQKGKRMRKERRKPTRLKEQEKKQNRTKLTSCTVGISEGGEGKKVLMTENFPNLEREVDIQIKKSRLRLPKSLNLDRAVLRNIITELSKVQTKKGFSKQQEIRENVQGNQHKTFTRFLNRNFSSQEKRG